MTRVVFLCGHNSARSQMAEGYLRALGGDRFQAESAGTVAGALHPLAVRTMAEVGIDISAHHSKSVDELAPPFDICVTVCDANCPIPPPAAVQLRWRIADPALARGSEDERMAAFRVVRDGIGQRVRALVARRSGTAPAGPSAVRRSPEHSPGGSR
jgi:arsenate reductase (thioredoxin)